MRLALALTLCLAPTAAHALVALPSTLTVVRPHHGEAAVPRNTRLWLDQESATEINTYATPREVRLFGPDDEPVPLGDPETIFTPGSQLLVYTPIDPLLQGTTYELRNCDGDECSHLIAAFTTASATDETPPEPPQIDRVHLDGNDVLLEAEFADNLLMIGHPDGTPDEPLIDGQLLSAAASPEQFVLTEPELPADHRLRFATYDLAGNFSGWTDPVAVEGGEPGCTPPDPGRTDPNTCRTAVPSPWLVLLPLILCRRKATP